MAKPITTTIKQGTRLVETSEEELKNLSEKAGTSPITPQGAVAIGANEAQAKMANVPVRKNAITQVTAPAPKDTLAQANRISTPLTPGAPAPEPAQDKLARMSELGGIPMQMEGLVRAKIAAATPVAAPIKLTPKESSVAQPISVDLNTALKAYSDAVTEADKEAAILAASKALGHTVTPAEIQTYFKSQEQTIAPVVAAVAGPITVKDLGLKNTAQLAVDLGVDEETLLSFTPDQLRQAIQNVEGNEFNRVQALQAELLSATGNRRQQIQQELQRLGQTGVANTEARYDDLQAQVESGNSITFAGVKYTIEELMSSNGLSRIITNAINSPEALEKLKKSEPELAAWISSNAATLAALSTAAGETAKASQATQNTVANVASTISPALFTALFGARPTNISAAEAAALQAKIDSSEAYKYAMASGANLRQLEDMVARGEALPVFGAAPAATQAPMGTVPVAPPPVGTQPGDGTVTPPGGTQPPVGTQPPIAPLSGGASFTETMQAQTDMTNPANAGAAGAVGWTSGKAPTPAQIDLFRKWQTALKDVNITVARDADFLKAIAPGGTLTPADMELLKGEDGLAVWNKALEHRNWAKSVAGAIKTGKDDTDRVEKLFNLAMGAGANGMSLADVNKALKKLESYANTGDAAAREAWVKMQQLVGGDGQLGPEDMELLSTLLSPKSQTLDYLIKNGGSIADTISGIKKQAQGAVGYAPEADFLRDTVVRQGFAADKFLTSNEMRQIFDGLDNASKMKLMDSPWATSMMDAGTVAEWRKNALDVNPVRRMRDITGDFMNDEKLSQAEMTELFYNNPQAFDKVMSDSASGAYVEGMEGWKNLDSTKKRFIAQLPPGYMSTGKLTLKEMDSVRRSNPTLFAALLADPAAPSLIDNHDGWVASQSKLETTVAPLKKSISDLETLIAAAARHGQQELVDVYTSNLAAARNRLAELEKGAGPVAYSSNGNTATNASGAVVWDMETSYGGQWNNKKSLMWNMNHGRRR